MTTTTELLWHLRPLHVRVGGTGHIRGIGRSVNRLGAGELTGRRFLDAFEFLSPAAPIDMAGLLKLSGQVTRLRLREAPPVTLRGLVLDDGTNGAIVDLSFGIAIVDAVSTFGLTAQDFSPSDLAVEMLFLHEAKSSALAASFSLNARLDGARAEAERQAMTDALTGLHNRLGRDSAFARLGQSRTDYAVLHVDLDLFKQVNDTMGHAAGDAVLRRVAAIMRRHTRKDDLLVRSGGDEFLIICPGLTDQARLSSLAAALITDISDEMDIEGHAVRISASIGIGVNAGDVRDTPEATCEKSDVALYAAKRAGRGRHVFWSEGLVAAPVAPERSDATLR